MTGQRPLRHFFLMPRGLVRGRVHQVILVPGSQPGRNPSRRYLSANHPIIRTPSAATSWASCLFAVDWYIMYLAGTLSSAKKPAGAGSLIWGWIS